MLRSKSALSLFLVIGSTLGILDGSSSGTSAFLTPGPLTVFSQNSRYFTDGSGKPIYLTGSHVWENFQDFGVVGGPLLSNFDYTSYLDFLQSHGHNFMRMWCSEGWEADVTPQYFAPMAYLRTGPGTALDGGLKYDLTKFDSGYFSRLRARVSAANDRGIYVSIMLFSGWDIQFAPYNSNPWPGHPYNVKNNINGVNGDANGNGQGEEVHTLALSTITNLQKAYIHQVIDTVNDLPNVLYEISNEDPGGTANISWQYEMINEIHSYELGKPLRHPVGMTGDILISDSALFSSPAEWISPAATPYATDPPAGDGSKVILVDCDHLDPTTTRNGDWIWKSFERGLNAIFMDGGIETFPPSTDAGRVSARQAMGDTRQYTLRMNLAAISPQSSLSSTGYCLANPGNEYLVYQPTSAAAFTVSLGAGSYSYEWFNPSTSSVIQTGAISAAGGLKPFIAPFGGTAVLYLKMITSTSVVLFSDDFKDGNLAGWTLSPAGFWSVVNGALQATGGTPSGWNPASAQVALPSGVTSWEASIATSTGASSNQGIWVSSPDGLYDVIFAINNGGALMWSVVLNGAWQGWHAAGSADPSIFHVYRINLDSSGTFSVLLDGTVLASGISAGAPSIWSGGLSKGALFAQAASAGLILNTRFETVAARGGSVPPPAPPNLIVNGDMESGIWSHGGWSGTSPTQTWATDAYHSPTHSLKTAGAAYFYGYWQAASIAVTAGQSFSMSIAVKNSNLVGGAGASLNVHWYSSSGSWISWAPAIGGAATGTVDWHVLSGRVTAPLGAVRAVVEIRIEGGAGATAWIDDVCMIKAP